MYFTHVNHIMQCARTRMTLGFLIEVTHLDLIIMCGNQSHNSIAPIIVNDAIVKDTSAGI